MGDRTFVVLTIPKDCQEKAEAIMQKTGGFPHASDNRSLICYDFEEVNYGRLDFLEKFQEAGIPYDSEWEQGDGYGPGGEYCRFTPEGDAVLKEIYDEDINPSLLELMKIINSGKRPAQRLASLEKYIKDHHEAVTFLPWTNQVAYGKRYLTRKLIEPTEQEQ